MRFPNKEVGAHKTFEGNQTTWKRPKRAVVKWLFCIHVDFSCCSFQSFIFLSGPSPIVALCCQSLSHWLMLLLRLDWCDPDLGVWRFTQHLRNHTTSLCLAVVSFDSHRVDIGTKQKSCCWCQMKSFLEEFLFWHQKHLSNFLNGFVKVVLWICLSCYMYLLPFAKQNQLKFDQDFE